MEAKTISPTRQRIKMNKQTGYIHFSNYTKFAVDEFNTIKKNLEKVVLLSTLLMTFALIKDGCNRAEKLRGEKGTKIVSARPYAQPIFYGGAKSY